MWFSNFVLRLHPPPRIPLCSLVRTQVRLTNENLKQVGYWDQLVIHKAEPATLDEMASFHDREYLEFLKMITPANKEEHIKTCRKYTIGYPDAVECPIYEVSGGRGLRMCSQVGSQCAAVEVPRQQL